LGSGSLTIQNGGVVSNTDGFIGKKLGGSGTVTVDGSDPNGNASTWTNSGNLTVGDLGTGTLDIQNGGTVSNMEASIGDQSGGNGSVTVDGVASTWTSSGPLFVGLAGTGSLTIQNGGQVDVALTTTIGSLGTLSINGSGLTTGSFNNYDGGTFHFNDGTLTLNGGTFDQGTVDLNLDGPSVAELPTLNITGGANTANIINAVVGDNNRGALNILSGGSVSNSNGIIGNSFGAAGFVTVDGSGSKWTNSGPL
ncbi:unnamed protein product, partial [marine sediment metagenome]